MEYEQKVRKKVWEIFGNSKKVTTFALAIERQQSCHKKHCFLHHITFLILCISPTLIPRRAPFGPMPVILLFYRVQTYKFLFIKLKFSASVYRSFLPIMMPSFFFLAIFAKK